MNAKATVVLAGVVAFAVFMCFSADYNNEMHKARELDMNFKIIQYLKEHGPTPRNVIRDKLKMGNTETRDRLHRLEKEGKVGKVIVKGKWWDNDVILWEVK
jgi:hypothetical protein